MKDTPPSRWGSQKPRGYEYLHLPHLHIQSITNCLTNMLLIFTNTNVPLSSVSQQNILGQNNSLLHGLSAHIRTFGTPKPPALPHSSHDNQNTSTHFQVAQGKQEYYYSGLRTTTITFQTGHSKVILFPLTTIYFPNRIKVLSKCKSGCLAGSGSRAYNS